MKSEKRNILLLGVGKDQLQAIKEAVDLGLGVIGFDGRAEAEGAKFCDYFEQVNIKDPDEVEKVALKWNKKVGIDGVMAPAVEVGISVGRVVDKLGLLGIGEDTAIKLTDKIERRKLLDKLKIPQPRWCYRDEKKAGLWDIFPCVAKKRDQSGARDVRLVESYAEVGINYDYLEEYLEGWEISTEVLVLPDQRLRHENADRNYDKKLKYRPYLLEDGCSLPSKLPGRMQDKIFILIHKLVHSLNLSSCAIKLDLLIKDNIVYCIECAPRLGGGRLSSHMIPAYLGVNYWGIAIKLAMGIKVEDKEFEYTKTTPTAQRYVFPEDPHSHADRITDFIETGKTVEEAIKKAEEWVKCYQKSGK